ncbi:MAG: ApaG domain, partial [Thiobacillus sp.]|nr:ApaG domain [Thiobacillus sp.]
MAEGKKYQISINVDTAYLAEQSDPSADRYVFTYTITITNSGTVAAQLISR